jgi:hypothetical protein
VRENIRTEPTGLRQNRPVWYQTGRFRLKPVGRFGFSTGSTRSSIKLVKPAGFGFGLPVFKTMVQTSQKTEPVGRFMTKPAGFVINRSVLP